MNDAFSKTITYGFILIIGAAISSPEVVAPFTIALGIVLGIEMGKSIPPDGEYDFQDYVLDVWLFGAMTFSAACLFATLAYLVEIEQISAIVGFTVSIGITTVIRRWTK